VSDQAAQRLWETRYDLLTDQQRRVLELLLEVREGAACSDLERWRKAPARPSSRNLKWALTRVAEISAVGLGELDPDAVPRWRLVELACYGMAAKAPQLRRHPVPRTTATLLATMVHLEAKAIDDCLELFDQLMVTELLGKAERETNAERLRQHPKLARAMATLAQAMRVVLETTGWARRLDWTSCEARSRCSPPGPSWRARRPPCRAWSPHPAPVTRRRCGPSWQPGSPR